MMQVSAAGVFSAVETAFPCPDPAQDGFAAAFWCQEMEEAFALAAAEAGRRKEEFVAAVQRAGMRSDRFRLEVPVSRVRAVDVASLRESLPEVFSQVVFLRSCDAERFVGRRRLYELSCAAAGTDRVRPFERVGRRRLYELSCAAAGTDRVRPFERVNVADLLRVLPPEEAERFVVVRERLMPVRVVCAEEGV